jgi:hypothetical protein
VIDNRRLKSLNNISLNDASVLGHAGVEHSKAIAKIKEIMDRSRAKKTFDFKTKMVSHPILSAKDSRASDGKQSEAKASIDNRLLLQIYNQKDNLFFEK